MTNCTTEPLLYSSLGCQQVVADFAGGILTSDNGPIAAARGVVVSVRRVVLHIASSYPLQDLFGQTLRRLQATVVPDG